MTTIMAWYWSVLSWNSWGPILANLDKSMEEKRPYHLSNDTYY